VCQRIINSQTAGAVAPFYSASHRGRETGALNLKNAEMRKAKTGGAGVRVSCSCSWVLPFVGLLAGHIV
jgi:hypothetical protein